MRHPGLTLAAAAIAAAALSACNKPANAPPAETTTTSTPTAAPAPMTDEEKKAALAKLPAPYNAADLDNGESKFALCSTCHTLQQGGPNMTGPNLYGVFGRKAATSPGFTYSDALKAVGWSWDAQHLDSWITDPKVAAPGTKMTFAGLKDPKDRTDVIAYVMIRTGFKP
ncbi:cytochrome c family protein [Phenylobacterium sp.]|jgi:cytochrome c|uniref:c-type cytochrome n=1 Tax=Phenylobacterium sp. TaxID=1871053 RepID=UPI002E327A1F|nr:cytochrome c family protein [Phenylobacterium sp.]HEX3367811.1 cytochrome c family protein [Phenylobacterium sp.]